MSKLYEILLDNIKIGTTKLEKSDAPMGVVFGKITFLDSTPRYEFFKEHCLKNGIFFDNYPEEKILSTRHIPALKVFNEMGVEISGMACSVSGTHEDSFEIYIAGIEYPFYESEFPHHVKTYREMFSR